MRRLRTSRAALLTPAIALGLLLSGCATGSGGNTSDGSSSSSSDAAPAAADKNDMNPVKPADLAQGGDLRWPLAQIPSNFNYNELDGTLADNFDVVMAMMPRPYDFDAAANPSVNQDYYTSIELTSKSPQVVTYTINPKAVWSDGTPITAADFVAQWKALNGTNPDFKVSSTNGYAQISDVKVGTDDRQAVVTFSKPYGDWKALFDPLYPASTNSDPAVFNDGWTEKPQVTGGAFQLEGVDSSAQTITLVPNPAWWGDKPKLDRIIYRALDPDAQIDSLANGEIDFIDIGPNANAYKRAQDISSVKIRRAGGPNFRHTTFNGSSAVLKDVKVRRALAQAIDRTAIAKAMLGPLGGTPTELNNHIFMANQTGYQDNSGSLAKADVKKANSELDAAGWKRKGEGTRTKGGKPLEIRYVMPSGVATSAQEGQLIQGMLEQVGAEVKIQTVPTADYFSKYVTPGDFDLTDFSWIGTQFPISSGQSIYIDPKGDDIQQNFARIGSPKVDKLYEASIADLDPKSAAKKANEVDAAIWDEVHSLTLYQRPDLIASNTKLANFGAKGFANVRYDEVGFTK